MEYMGLALFPWIVGGSCIGLYIADRTPPPKLSRASLDPVHPAPHASA